MRNLLITRFPWLTGKLRSVKNILLRTAVLAKRKLINTGKALSHFSHVALQRNARKEFIRYAQPKIEPVRFLQGLRTSYSPRSVWRWHRWNDTPLFIAVVDFNGNENEYETFCGDVGRVLNAQVVRITLNEFKQLGSWFTQNNPHADVVIADGALPLPDANDILLLKHAAHNYHNHPRAAIVTPSQQDASGASRSLYANRASGSWGLITNGQVRDYKQDLIPRYVLGAQAHGAYLKQSTIRRFLTQQESDSIDEIFNSWVRNVIHSGGRVLEFSPARIISPAPDLNTFGNLDWFFHREVTTSADAKLPIVFVLPATSMSGGIRAVLEKAEALIALGEKVEVWALQGNPTWTEISFDVRKFNSYDDLTDALSLVDAIKVATWWETAEPVLLASLQRGIPVQYVQEFESWFYPNSETSRAAVVSSYRPEFAYTTTASYQQSELAEIGIDAPIIPPAYDAELFSVEASAERESNTLLALGRTFFQKNFKQTAEAWKALGESRPRLQLFGFEPDVLHDPRVNYAVQPSDEEIAQLYRTATAFIQTSLHEGFSLPIMEAMACGCPVITTDSHGNRDFCIDEVNCLMVEQGDIENTAKAIERLMSDPKLRARLSQAGIETAKRYSWNRVARETQQMYRQFAERSARR